MNIAQPVKNVIAVLWILVFLASPATMASPDKTEDIAKAQQAAHAWLQLLDAGSYGESWDAASSFWQADHTREKTAQVLKALHAPLRPIVSRKLKAAEFLVVPDGDCVHIQFESEFANKGHHIETLDMLREKNGEWKVALWAQRSRD